MNATRTLDAQPFEAVEAIQGYTSEQLRSKLERYRLKALPRRTLDHWLKCLSITRNDFGLFEENDYLILKALIHWLRTPGRTIEGYREFLIQQSQRQH